MTPERFRKLNAVLDRRQPDLTVVSEDVHKLHNVSAVLRSCDAAGVFAIHAVTGAEELRAHHDMAGGSWRWVRVHRHDRVEAAIQQLKNKGFHIFAADLSNDCIDYRAADYTRATAIVLGAELTGVSPAARALADACVRIPMYGMVESLNVSVANALILFEAARQRAAAGLYDRCRLDRGLRQRTLFEWCYPEIAARCRSAGRPYPELDENGLMRANPLAERTAPRTSNAGS